MARSPDTETIRIRDVRETRSKWAFSESARAAIGLSLLVVMGACRIVDLEMYVRANDNAPPMRVVGVAARWLSFVSSSSFAKFCKIVLSTTAKGRYLLGLSWCDLSAPLPFILTSPLVSPFRSGCEDALVGYKKLVLWECDAITATSFALPDAR